MPLDGKDITGLLNDLHQGREGAMDELMAAVYDELRAAADRLMRREVRPGRPGATLQPTALVNETFLKFIKRRHEYDKRGHFFVAFTTCMLQVLLDYVRRQTAKKRGGGWRRVPLDPDSPGTDDGADIVAFVDALKQLEGLDPRKADVVKLRVLCGLTVAETAESLGIGHATVERDWSFAKAWLRKELRE